MSFSALRKSVPVWQSKPQGRKPQAAPGCPEKQGTTRFFPSPLLSYLSIAGRERGARPERLCVCEAIGKQLLHSSNFWQSSCFTHKHTREGSGTLICLVTAAVSQGTPTLLALGAEDYEQPKALAWPKQTPADLLRVLLGLHLPVPSQCRQEHLTSGPHGPCKVLRLGSQLSCCLARISF